jgi:hypothetical protein
MQTGLLISAPVTRLQRDREVTWRPHRRYRRRGGSRTGPPRGKQSFLSANQQTCRIALLIILYEINTINY